MRDLLSDVTKNVRNIYHVRCRFNSCKEQNLTSQDPSSRGDLEHDSRPVADSTRTGGAKEIAGQIPNKAPEAIIQVKPEYFAADRGSALCLTPLAPARRTRILRM